MIAGTLIEGSQSMELDMPEKLPRVATPKTPRVLLVEDCDETREFLVELARAAGLDPSSAINGIDCIEQVRLARDAGRPFDAVFLDLGLPDFDGCAVTRVLRQSEPRLPIIAMTSSPSLLRRRESVHATCDAFLAKWTIGHTMVPTLESLL